MTTIIVSCSKGLALMFTIIQILIMWWKWSSFRRGCSIHVALHLDAHDHVGDVDDHFVDVKVIMLTMYCLLVTEIMSVPIFSVNMFPYNSMNVALYVKQTVQGEASSELVWSRWPPPPPHLLFVAWHLWMCPVKIWSGNFRTILGLQLLLSLSWKCSLPFLPLNGNGKMDEICETWCKVKSNKGLSSVWS